MADIFLDVKDNFAKAQSSWRNLSGSITSTSRKFDGCTKSMNRMQGAMRNLNGDANRNTTSFLKLGSALNKLNIAGNVFILQQFANVLAKCVQSTVDQTEVVNMFSVAMGELAEETYKTLYSISSTTGIDLTNLEQATGTFNTLARSMGISEKNAQTLSVSVTQLAYDLSSLYNIQFDQVLADLKSGLIGQTETVYKYGMDLTEASLKQSDLTKEMGKSVRQMTQGEKMLARYDIMLKNSSLAMGDFTRTIETPANQLRILGENVVSLGRAVGGTLYPILARVLPLIRGVVMALTTLFSILGGIFGYTASGAKNMKNGIGGVADSLDDATGSAGGLKKALDDITAPFDELNVVKDDTSSGGGGGGISGITDSAIASLEAYNTLLNSVNDKAIQIKENILHWLGFTKDLNPETGEIVWKLDEGYTNLEKIRTALTLIGIVISGIKIIQFANGFKSMIAGSSKLKDLSAFLALSKESGGMLNTFKTLYPVTAKLSVVLAAVVVAYIRLTQLWEKSADFRTGVTALFEALKKAITWLADGLDFLLNEVIAFIRSACEPLADFLEALDLDFADLAITVAGLAMVLTGVGAPFGVFLLILEGVTLAIRAFGELMSPAIESVDLFGENISTATKDKIQPFMTDMEALDNMLTQLDWADVIISEEDVTAIGERLSRIVKTITDELDADKNTALSKISPLKDYMSEEDFGALANSTDIFYEQERKKLQEYEAKINDIIEKANKEKRSLTEKESDDINAIYTEMYKIGIKDLSETEIEAKSILTKFSLNRVAMSAEQTSALIQDAIKLRDETVNAAITQYSQIELEANRMLSAKAISQEQYDEMIAAAQKARDESIDAAHNQYKGILNEAQTQYPEIMRYIDLENGEIKTKFQMLTEDITKFFKITWELIQYAWKEAPSWFQDTVITPVTEKFSSIVEGIGNFFSTLWTNIKTIWEGASTWFKTGVIDPISGFFHDMANGVIGLFEGMINSIIRLMNRFIGKINTLSGAISGLAGKVGIDIDLAIPPIKEVNIPRLARGGILDGGLFQAGEMGKYEMVGNYQGKTTVMPLENTSFVSAMYDAVYGAMMASSENGKTVIENVLNLDGEVLYKNQQKVASGKGVNFVQPAFAR